MSKEKAEELVTKMFNIQTSPASWSEAKECAIISCQRTIDILKEIQEKENSDLYFYLEEKIIEETQILEEIKKL